MTLAWRIPLEKVPTRIIHDRKMVNLESIMCLLCSQEVKILNHLFLSCDIALAVSGIHVLGG